MAILRIYTDGACAGNQSDQNIGGWGAILEYGAHQKELFGGQANTTNNRMELTAVIEALKLLKEPCKVNLYSDSAYVVNAFLNDWISSWKANGWKGSDKKQVKNLDLWLELDNLCTTHDVTFIKVKGHADNEFNNRCDLLATSAINKISIE